jgi:prepilin-type N-terminal cleavage/methylation domain-containing protein
MRRIVVRGRGPDGDRGDTLIETMIVMIIFTIVLGIVTTAIVTMLQQVDKQSGVADNLGNARKAIETLDGQVRFANAVTTPGTVASGDQYVEFQALATNVTNQPQICTQWRYHVATKALQFRTWTVPTSGSAVPSAWLTSALSISPAPGMPIFGFSPPPPATTPTLPAPGLNTPPPHQTLYVDFIATDGSPPQTTTSQVGLTAINSVLNPVPPSPSNNSVCQEVGRP